MRTKCIQLSTSEKMNSDRFKSTFWLVGEHCVGLRRCIVRCAGGITRAYVDTSSDKAGEKPARRKSKVS